MCIRDRLTDILDEKDGLHQYDFENINQIMPLLYYDQIKARNTPNFAKDSNEVALPFFMNFRNLTEEKEKIQNEMKEELKSKKQEHQRKRDKLLEN